MGMINSKENFPEGEVYFRWEDARIKNNKNVISVTTGSTGSGKSTTDLKRAEISHKRRFKEEFPIENVCFSIVELMKRISSGNLRKGEVIILEEAGFNAGSQDWQNKTTKLFNYLLQTFRSMNICLYLNLPVLSMLAKQARQLVHIHFETCGIDFENKSCKIKPLVHQLNQHSGKSYWKYLRIRSKGKVIALQRMNYTLPSQKLIDKYEAKKHRFLLEITTEFTRELEEKDREKLNRMARNDLTEVQMEVVKMIQDGLSVEEIAKRKNVSMQGVYDTINRIKKKGYEIIPKKNQVIQLERQPI